MFRKIPLAWSLKKTFAEGYTSKAFVGDLQAGIVVGVVAIPLGMALAIASGVPPQYGLYTVIIAGILTSVLGGSKTQVTGPTAAFVVLLLPVVHKFGIAGLLVAGMISGGLTLIYGLLGLGQWIRYVPHPVTTGFTSGIAVVIGFLQLKDFFGLQYDSHSEVFVEKLVDLFANFGTFRVNELIVGFSTIFLIFFFLKKVKSIPAPITALTTVVGAISLIKVFFPDLQIDTISSRFHYIHNGETLWGIPQIAPQFVWPWTVVADASSPFVLNWSNIVAIFPSALSISLLGAIESLLCAMIAEGITQETHNPDSELIALGIANIICPFFAGIPATGAIARTSTNIRFGGKSPIACLTHAVFTLLAVLTLAPLIGRIPMASLAALLIFVAWNMSERHHFTNILRMDIFEDKAVLLTCFVLTVFMDMTVGVSVGIVLACLLFVKRVADLTKIERLTAVSHHGPMDLPADVFYYRIRGAFFFGVAGKAVNAITNISGRVNKIILDFSDVTMMDMTGLVALDSALRKNL